MNKFQFLKGLVPGIIDSFNRSNSTSSLGNTDTGQTWTNSAIYAHAMGINGNAAYSASNVDTAAVVETNKANGVLTIVVGTYAQYMGFVFRYTDNNNYCICEFSDTGSTIGVSGKVSGSTFGPSAVTAPVTNGDTIKIVMSGTSVTIYVNNVLKGTLTVSQNSSATKHGIKIYGTVARIDSFRYDQV